MVGGMETQDTMQYYQNNQNDKCGHSQWKNETEEEELWLQNILWVLAALHNWLLPPVQF